MVGFIWSVAEIIAWKIPTKKYQDITLPMTVLRRFDTIIEAKQDEVRVANEKFKATIDDKIYYLEKLQERHFTTLQNLILSDY